MIFRRFAGNKYPTFGPTKLDFMRVLRFFTNDASDQTIVDRAIKRGIPHDGAATTAQSGAKVVQEETRIEGNPSRKCARPENLHENPPGLISEPLWAGLLHAGVADNLRFVVSKK